MNYAYYLRGYLDRNNKLTSYPAQGAKRQIVLRWLASQFWHGTDYSEPEVNSLLNQLHTFGDAARLRRELVDARLFDRSPDGARYWKLYVASLADTWTTERCTVTNSTPNDIEALHAIALSCSHLVSVDPTFITPDRAVFEEFVGRSTTTSVRSAELFRIQSIRTKDDDRIVGYFHVYHAFPYQHVVWVSFFVIDRALQGMGYGKEIVEGLKHEILALHDYSALWLDVFVENTTALQFWIGRGFRSIDKYTQHEFPNGRTVGSLALCCQLG